MSDGQALLAIAGGVLASIAIIAFGVFWTVAYFDAPYQSRQCTRYGQSTGREVQFRQFSHWSYDQSTGREVQFRQFSHWSYDCFVRLDNGVWVSKDQIRGLDQ